MGRMMVSVQPVHLCHALHASTYSLWVGQRCIRPGRPPQPHGPLLCEGAAAIGGLALVAAVVATWGVVG